MSWTAVARKDFEDAVRSRWVLGLSALFVVLVSAVAYVVRPAEGSTMTSNGVLNSLFVKDALVTTLIPLISLIVAYNAIVGERETGSLKLLLALPHSRADVVFGKVFGRAGAVAAPILVGFLLPAMAFLVVDAVTFKPVAYVGFALLTALLATTFVAIAVGFSAATPSHRLALAGAVGIYFLFVPLWGVLQFPLRLYFGLGGGPEWLPITGPEVLRTLRLINPTGSFKIVADAYLAGNLFRGGGARLQAAAALMLLVWVLLPPLLGLLRFESVDL